MSSKLERVVEEMRTMDERDLRKILEFAVKRTKFLRLAKAEALMATLEEGDKVRVGARIKPAYMAGRVGTVIRVLNTKVEVRFDAPMRRFGDVVRVPASSLERVEEKTTKGGKAK